jgi:hypothetical protein
MASTRNINTRGNYCLQQQAYTHGREYTVYANSAYGEAYNTKLPGNGLLPGQMPWNKLSNNAADIESFLYGINSTNLVNPAGPLTPELTQLQSANIFDKSPTLMPEPLVIEKNQRPFPLP